MHIYQKKRSNLKLTTKILLRSRIYNRFKWKMFEFILFKLSINNNFCLYLPVYNFKISYGLYEHETLLKSRLITYISMHGPLNLFYCDETNTFCGSEIKRYVVELMWHGRLMEEHKVVLAFIRTETKEYCVFHVVQLVTNTSKLTFCNSSTDLILLHSFNCLILPSSLVDILTSTVFLLNNLGFENMKIYNENGCSQGNRKNMNNFIKLK